MDMTDFSQYAVNSGITFFQKNWTTEYHRFFI